MNAVSRYFLCLLTILLSACANIYNFDDPREDIQVSEIVKSIRCEVFTFLSTNRKRQILYDDISSVDFDRAISDFSYLPIDEKQYGLINIDLKHVNLASLSIGLDAKIPVTTAPDTLTGRLGFGLASTQTSQIVQPYIFPQSGVLTSVDDAAKSPSMTAADYSFQCYARLPRTDNLKEDLPDYEGLSKGDYPELELFRRIYASEREPMAAYMQKVGSEMSANWLARPGVSDYATPAQIIYNSTLLLKPGFDGKVTLFAGNLAPFLPSAAASSEQTNSFSIILNTRFARFATGARVGGAIIEPDKVTTKSSAVGAGPQRKSQEGGSFLTAPFIMELPDLTQ